MKKMVTCLLMCSLVLLSSCAGMNKQDTGALSGAAIGGALGSRFGHGNGAILTTVAGAVIGTIVGSSIGKNMDDVDRMKMNQALESNRTNQASSWVNPDTNAKYTVTPTRTFQEDNRYCREYVTRALIAGKQQQIYGTACRKPDGTWEVLSSHE